MSQGVGCLNKGKMGDGRRVPSSEMGAKAILQVCACETAMLKLKDAEEELLEEDQHEAGAELGLWPRKKKCTTCARACRGARAARAGRERRPRRQWTGGGHRR